jgi:ElaB/YqjD/DUF883 family membrane-anchored ribosome-binding protein
VGKDKRDVGAQVAGTDDPEAIRAQIEQTRDELGDTVAALSYKTDVKARTREKVDEARTTVTEKVDEARTTVSEKVDEARTTVSEKADELATKAKDAMPPAAQERVSELQRSARQNPRRAVAVVAGALGAMLVLLRVRRRG